MTDRQPVPTFVKLAKEFAREKRRTLLPQGLSYDDVCVLPGRSQVKTLDEIDTRTEIVKGEYLAIPLISANMDTVTEAPMAITMAQRGGLGAIHRALSITDAVAQVKKVKDATRYVVDDAPILHPTDRVEKAKDLMEERQRGFIVVRNDKDEFVGLATSRDVKHPDMKGFPLSEVMTPRDRVISANPGISMEAAAELMWKHRIEKLPLIDSDGKVVGVVTDRDLRIISQYPNATKDSKGRLKVAAAIGVQDEAIERAEALIAAGVDYLVVDVLHGDAENVEKTTRAVKKLSHTVPTWAGNVATPESTRRLIDFGADAVKVGYGDGSVCTTRVKTGTGRSQFRAVVECAAEGYKWGIPIIADGSIKDGGEVVKAISAGASTVMVGSAFSGTDESPGQLYRDDVTGEQYKIYRGMASAGAHEDLARSRGATPKKREPQGIQGRSPYKGSVNHVIDALVNGYISGVANAGGKDKDSLQNGVMYERQTPAGHQEGKPHGVSTGRVR